MFRLIVKCKMKREKEKKDRVHSSIYIILSATQSIYSIEYIYLYLSIYPYWNFELLRLERERIRPGIESSSDRDIEKKCIAIKENHSTSNAI